MNNNVSETSPSLIFGREMGVRWRPPGTLFMSATGLPTYLRGCPPSPSCWLQHHDLVCKRILQPAGFLSRASNCPSTWSLNFWVRSALRFSVSCQAASTFCRPSVRKTVKTWCLTSNSSWRRQRPLRLPKSCCFAAFFFPFLWQNRQRWNVTKYIYSSAVLKYNFDILFLLFFFLLFFIFEHFHSMLLHTSTPLHFRGKLYTFYSSTISISQQQWPLSPDILQKFHWTTGSLQLSEKKTEVLVNLMEICFFLATTNQRYSYGQ